MEKTCEYIHLTKNNYKKYDLLDIVSFSIATAGAMGDAGSFIFVAANGKLYYANPLRENISYEEIEEVFPLVSEIKLGVFSSIKKPDGWNSIYLGFGNFLFIHKVFYSKFLIEVNRRKINSYDKGILYQEWLDIVNYIIDRRNEKFDIEEKIKGTIYGQAIGDALGLATEFMDKAEMAQKYPHGVESYSDICQDAHRKKWKTGEWTDDTDMMLCIANAFIDDHGVNLSHIARNFKDWACDKPRGIGVSTFKVLSIGDYVEKPFEVSKLIWEMNRKQSAANGGLMRTSVVSILPSDIEKHAADICRLTHFDPRCVGSCVIVSELIHSLVYGGFPFSFEQIIDLGNKYDDRIKEYIFMAKDGTIDSLDLTNEQSMGYTLKTLAVALWAYWHCSSFEEGLLTIVNAGGDADTNAAVTCAILGAKFGFSSIPDGHVNGLLYKERLDDVSKGLMKIIGIK